MTKKISPGEKATHLAGKYSTRNQIIAGVFLIASVIITGWLIKSKSNNKGESNVQKVKEQKVDTGSINNYNAGGDIKIENITNSGGYQSSDSIKTPNVNPISNQKTNIHEQTNVSSHNQSGGQTAKEIINNNN